MRDGVGQIVHAIRRLGGIHHLDKDNAIDPYRDVILGYDVLLGHIQHLLHHVDAAPNDFDEGREEGDAGLKGASVSAEPLYGKFPALRHDLDRPEQDNRGQNDQNKRDNIHTDSFCCTEQL